MYPILVFPKIWGTPQVKTSLRCIAVCLFRHIRPYIDLYTDLFYCVAHSCVLLTIASGCERVSVICLLVSIGCDSCTIYVNKHKTAHMYAVISVLDENLFWEHTKSKILVMLPSPPRFPKTTGAEFQRNPSSEGHSLSCLSCFRKGRVL